MNRVRKGPTGSEALEKVLYILRQTKQTKRPADLALSWVNPDKQNDKHWTSFTTAGRSSSSSSSTESGSVYPEGRIAEVIAGNVIKHRPLRAGESQRMSSGTWEEVGRVDLTCSTVSTYGA